MPKHLQKYIVHITGSLLFLSIPVLSSPDLTNAHTHLFDIAPFRQSFFQYVLLLVFFYVNYFYLIPHFYFRQRYFLFVLGLAVCFAVISFLPDYVFPWNRQMMYPPRGFSAIMPNGMPAPQSGNTMAFSRNRHMPLFFGGGLWQFLLVSSLSFLVRVNQRLSSMESEKLKTEVSYLKAQINPHFLFNTLNSLYALTLEKSDAAPNAILKLSGMMRYVVTESSRERVALQSELDYIQNYISLQRLRMDEATTFTYTVTGPVAGRQISPLILIPFIENAFKYGLNPEKESAIHIAISIEADQLTMVVRNNKVITTLLPEEVSGRGVENTRLRLEYLYPERHSLSINETEDIFEVKLIILLV